MVGVGLGYVLTVADPLDCHWLGRWIAIIEQHVARKVDRTPLLLLPLLAERIILLAERIVLVSAAAGLVPTLAARAGIPTGIATAPTPATAAALLGRSDHRNAQNETQKQEALPSHNVALLVRRRSRVKTLHLRSVAYTFRPAP